MEGIAREVAELIDARAAEMIEVRRYDARVALADQGIFDEVYLEISSTDLQARLTSRAEYHRERAKFYTEQSRTLFKDEEQQNTVSNYTQGDPGADMKRQAHDHTHKAAKFDVMSQHLREGTYRLDITTMTQLELDKASS